MLMAIIIMGGVAFFFSTVLVIADKKLRVEVDPRIEEIAALLPQANCGGCGFPGCKGYATAIVMNGAPVGKCAPSGAEVNEAIGRIMGVEVSERVRRVVRVHCRGAESVAARKALYVGIPSCQAVSMVQSGDKLCDWGCLGYGDCAKACPFGGITLGENGLPQVNEEVCTGCGLCVASCPKKILQLHGVDERVIVACRSEDPPKQAKSSCANACIGCGICARACPEAVEVKNHLACVKDPGGFSDECIAKLEKCPTGAIGPIDQGKAEALRAEGA